VTILGGLEIDGLCQIEFLDDDAGTHVKVVPDDINEFIGGLARRAIGIDKKR